MNYLYCDILLNDKQILIAKMLFLFLHLLIKLHVSTKALEIYQVIYL